jgi:hypothetical protein
MKSPSKFKRRWKDITDEAEKNFAMPQNTYVFLKENYLQKLFFSEKITVKEYYIRKKVLETI